MKANSRVSESNSTKDKGSASIILNICKEQILAYHATKKILPDNNILDKPFPISIKKYKASQYEKGHAETSFKKHMIKNVLPGITLISNKSRIT